MAEFIVMPKLGFDMREAELVSWLKEEGDDVEKGEIVAEIESDKATLELEAQASGILLKKLEQEGAIVPVGADIAIVGEEGEDISGMEEGDREGAEAGAEAAEEKRTEEAAAEEEEAHGETAAQAAAPEEGVGEEFPGGVKATPVARRMASEHGVDLKAVSGSGPGGRVRKADVEAYLERAPEEAEEVEERAVERAAAVEFEPTAVPTGPDTTEVPTSRMRQAIARRMVESKTTVPHFYVTSAIEMDKALALRKEINGMLPEEEKVTVNDMIVKAAALALRDFPNINSSFAGDNLVRHERINVGTAVAVEGGLLTVVQRDTDTSTLSKIATDNKEMIERARSGKIRPDDVQGATFTVSNLGAFDVENFIAIVNPPEAAILAVGTAKQVPLVHDGEVTIGSQMKATISADHRVTDGAEAARYMQTFKSILEEPMRLLV